MLRHDPILDPQVGVSDHPAECEPGVAAVYVHRSDGEETRQLCSCSGLHTLLKIYLQIMCSCAAYSKTMLCYSSFNMRQTSPAGQTAVHPNPRSKRVCSSNHDCTVCFIQYVTYSMSHTICHNEWIMLWAHAWYKSTCINMCQCQPSDQLDKIKQTNTSMSPMKRWGMPNRLLATWTRWRSSTRRWRTYRKKLPSPGPPGFKNRCGYTTCQHVSAVVFRCLDNLFAQSRPEDSKKLLSIFSQVTRTDVSLGCAAS